MAGLFGGGTKNSSQTPNYTKIQLQTSALGLCIPIGWGKFRAAPNLIDYVDFQKKKVKTKGKGGLTGGKGTGQYTYSATIFLALCEGPIQSIGLVYKNQDTITFASSGFTLFNGTADQVPASYLVSFHPDHALSYSQTAYVGVAFYDLGSGATLPQHNFEVIGKFYATTASPDPHHDANMADIVSDFLTNPQYSIGLPSSAIDATSLAAYRTYTEAYGLWFSPYLSTQEQVSSTLQRWAQITNSWIFWSGDRLKFVPLSDCSISANGVVYTPNTQAIYDLTYDDFIVSNPGDTPVKVTRSDPSDGYNRVRIHAKDRLSKYASTPIDWVDQTSADRYGVLQAQEVQADEICDLNVASRVAMLLGLRAVYVRNTFKFTLGYGFVLLEPGDIVTVTEPNIGLDRAYIRISEIEENENGLLNVAAEEFPYDCAADSGTFASITAPAPTGGLFVPLSTGTDDPGNVNTPLIYEPPVQVTSNGQPSLWIGASGGANWGGANVYISFDGTTYSSIGTINTPSAQGVLTATLANHADPDSTDTLSIDLAESEAVLQSTATHADADAFRTLAAVGNELLAYGAVASGTSANAFNLTYLRRGVYGTTAAAHSSGAQFTRVDLSALLEYPLQQRYVGQTLYFKFTSFNLLGAETQDLSAVSAYTYTPTGWQFGTAAGAANAGNLLSSAPSAPAGLSASALPAAAALSWTVSTDPTILSYAVFRAAGLGASFGSATQTATIAAPASAYVDSSAAGSTAYTYFLEAANAAGNSAASSGANVTTLAAVRAASYAGGLTATGTGQSDAYALSVNVSVFTTVASGTGAVLPASPTAGDSFRVVNRGANDLAVYPASGGAIEGFGTNAAAAVAVGDGTTFIAQSSTQWLAT